MIAQALSESDTANVEHADGVDAIQEMFNALDEEQQVTVYTAIAHAFGDTNSEGVLEHSNNEGDSI